MSQRINFCVFWIQNVLLCGASLVQSQCALKLVEGIFQSNATRNMNGSGLCRCPHLQQPP